MDHDTKLQRFIRKCQKLINYLKFMANLVLIFLYLQNIYFTSVSNSFLTPKVNAVAGACVIVTFIVLLYMEGNSTTETTKLLTSSIFKDKSMFFMALPPMLFVVSWECFHLSYVLYPSTTAMAKNFKILSLAIFSILILGRRFFMTQILGICFVAYGMFRLMQVPVSTTEFDDLSKDPIETCLIISGILSYGLSFVLLERQLKLAESSFWITGIQYSIYFVPCFLIVSCYNDWLFHNDLSFLTSSDIFTWFYIVFVTAQMIMEFFVIRISDTIFMNMSYSIAYAFIMLFGQSLKISGYGAGFIIYGIMLYIFLEFTQSMPVRRENAADMRIIDRIYPIGDCKEVRTFLPKNDSDHGNICHE